jgi:hypothetical protein
MINNNNKKKEEKEEEKEKEEKKKKKEKQEEQQIFYKEPLKMENTISFDSNENFIGSDGNTIENNSNKNVPNGCLLSEWDPLSLTEFGKFFSMDFYTTNVFNLIQELTKEYDQMVYILEKAQKRLFSLRQIMKLFNQYVFLQKKIQIFEEKNKTSTRFFGNSLHFLEEEKFRKQIAKKYHCLRQEVNKWMMQKDDVYDFHLLGKDMKQLLLDVMNTQTNLMHLDLGMALLSTSTSTTSPIQVPVVPVQVPVQAPVVLSPSSSSSSTITTTTTSILNTTSTPPPPVPSSIRRRERYLSSK